MLLGNGEVNLSTNNCRMKIYVQMKVKPYSECSVRIYFYFMNSSIYVFLKTIVKLYLFIITKISCKNFVEKNPLFWPTFSIEFDDLTALLRLIYFEYLNINSKKSYRKLLQSILQRKIHTQKGNPVEIEPHET